MAKLKNLSVTIEPKLDTQKTKLVAKKLGVAFKKAAGSVGNFASKAGKFATGMNQGIQLLEQIKSIVNKSGGLVDGVVSSGDSLADLASMANVSAGQLDSLVHSFKEGSSSGNTLEMFQQFLQKAQSEDRQIAGFGEDGRSYNSIDSFMGVIKELNRLKTAIHSEDSSVEEKNTAIKRESEILNQYFGAKKSKGMQDIIGSYGSVDKNKLDAATQRRVTLAANEAEATDSRIGMFEIESNSRKLTEAYEKGLFIVSEENKKLEMLKAENTIKNADAKSMIASNQLVSKIDEIIDMGVGKITSILGTILTAIQDFKDTFANMKAGFESFIKFVKNPASAMKDLFFSNRKKSVQTSFEPSLDGTEHGAP